MSATTEQQLAELRRANETLQQERDAARAELRACVEQTAAADLGFVKAENEELRAAQAAGLEVLQTMAASPGMTEPVFDLIARQAAKLCDAPIAMVGMFDGAMLHLVTQSGFDDAYTAVFASQFPRPPSPDFAMGRAILSGRIEEIENTGTPDRNGFKPPPGPGSALAVPLMRNGTPLGVIAVGRRVTGPFPRNQVTLLRTFAEQAVIAITSSETYRALAQRNSEYGERIEHQSATIDVLKAMAASPGDAQPVFDLITRRAKDLCNAPSVVLFEYDGAFVYLRSECGTVSGSGRDALEAYKRLFPLVPTRASISCRAILDRKIIHIRDMKSEPGLLGVVRDLGHRSNLVVPLMRGDAAIGAVSLSSWEVGGFAESQVGLMKTFAEQAVIAISSAETYRALQDRTSDLEESLKYQTATSDVLSVISRSTFDLQPVLESLVTTAANLCDAEMAAIIRREGSLFRLMVSRGFPADFVADRYGRGATQLHEASVTGRATRERRIIHVHDVAAEPNYPQDSIAVGKQRSSLGVPLLREGEVVGVILLARQRVKPFTDRQIELVRTFADQAVIAMENARLLDELHQRSGDLQESLEYQTAISEVLRVISSSTFDLEPVFGTVAATAVRLCRAHQAGIYLRHDDEYRWAGGFSQLPDYEKIEREVRIQPGSGTLVGRVALEGRAVQILDAWTDALYEAKEDAQVGAIHTLLGVPLLRDGQTLGVIGIGRQEVEPFTERQIELVSTFADQAVIAIENARLLEELREALEQQTATAEVLQVINASPGNLGPVFDAILEKAHIVCGAEYGALLTYDGELFWPAAMHGDRLANSEAFRRGIRPGSGFSKLLRGERLLHIHDMAELAEMTPEDPIPRALVDVNGIRTQLAIPLRRDGKLLGVITANRREVRPFSGKEITLLENFASQAVIAMENARLITETREALEQQTATAEVLQVINGSPGSLTPVFEAILEKAHSLCGATKGAFLTFDGEHFQVAATRGLSDAYTRVLQSNSHRRVKAGYATGEISPREQLLEGADLVQLMGQDVALGPIGRAAADLEKIRTVLFVPLRRDGRLLGYITAYRQEEAPFSDKQIAVLQSFAAQAVIAMENARLITETREALEQQTAVADVLQVINASPGDLGPVFDVILEKAVNLCEASLGVLHRYDAGVMLPLAARGPSGMTEAVLETPLNVDSGTAVERLLHGDPIVHIADVTDTDTYRSGVPSRRKLVEMTGARTALWVALRKDAAFIGTLVIYRTEVRPFSPKEIALVENFAAQAVIAMENARLLDELRARTAELARRNSEYGERIEHQSATIDVLKAMSNSPDDTRPVFDLITRHAQELCNSKAAGIFEYDGELVHIASMYGAADIGGVEDFRRAFPMRPTRGSIACRAILDKRTVHIHDMWTEQELLPTVRALGIRSNLAIPLLRNGIAVGVFNVNSLEPGGFTDSQVSLVQTFAEQAVIAMTSVANFRALRERTADLTRSVSELQALEEVLRAVNSSLDLDTVLATIISRAVQLSNADEGTIYEFDKAQGVFVPKSGYGMSTDWLAQLRDRRIRIGEAPLGRSAAMQAPLHIPDLAEEPDDGSKNELLARGVRAMLAVPLLREDEVIGGLVIRRHTAGGFGASTATLLQTFAAQSVLAIENARLFRDAERERAAAETALSDLRRAQDRLVQSEKMASLGQLTAGIAHEIKNPLNFVNNFAELSVDLLDELHDAVTSNLATESEEIAALLKSNLARIAEHGRRADSIVKNMLLHSRSGPSEYRSVDLNAVVEEAMNLAYHGARAETPGFNITIERKLDPAAGTVEMFPQDFTRVMLNLISNGFYAAKQHADRNGSGAFVPVLTLTTRDQGNQVEIRVRDNGTGIASDVREKIFEPFFTTKPAGEGTGLGLSLSYDIVVKQHGGQLIVDSRPNEFTEFCITLPRRLAAHEGASA